MCVQRKARERPSKQKFINFHENLRIPEGKEILQIKPVAYF